MTRSRRRMAWSRLSGRGPGGMTRRRLFLVGLLAAAAAPSGCGVGAGEGPDGVSLTVTRDYGARALGTARAGQAPGGETVMRFLRRSFDVRTRYGGGFVQTIEGASGGREDGRPVDWFYYVNGIEASEGAAARKLHGGDRVWWDRHDWGSAMRVPAVVGSFPEPFRSGTRGKRFPVQVICTPRAGPACGEAKRRLAAAGIDFGSAAFGSPPGELTLRAVVGPWRELRSDLVAGRLEAGPGTSGVFARPARDGDRIELLDARGRTARTLRAGGGLVAALRLRDRSPTWVLTGADAAGTLAAARSLTERTLRNRFALAIDRTGTTSLPVAP
jgi:uncharacterized protein DUF4430